MSESVATVERRAVTRYLKSNWTRSALATYPSAPVIPDVHGKDEICPLVYFGMAFDPTKADDLSAMSSYAVRELKGFTVMQLDVLSGTWTGQTLPLRIAGGQWLLAAPGGDVVVYPLTEPLDDQTIDWQMEDETTFSATNRYTWLSGVGFLVVNLTEQEMVWRAVGSRAPRERALRLLVMIAAPLGNGPAVAEQYSGALATIWHGVVFSADEAAPVGSVERAMADSGLLRLYNPSYDPPEERAMRIGERDGWAWYSMTVPLRRVTVGTQVGLRTVG